MKIIFLVLVLFCSIAEAKIWKIDKAKSSITFFATQNGSQVKGEFGEFDGNINFDTNNLAKSSVKIVIDTKSVKSSYKEVADNLKLPEWFSSALFPKAVFESAKITKSGDAYTADGKLQIRNKILPVKLSFKFENYSNSTALAKGFVLINRLDFDVGTGEWASTKSIKNEVKIEFVIMAN